MSLPRYLTRWIASLEEFRAFMSSPSSRALACLFRSNFFISYSFRQNSSSSSLTLRSYTIRFRSSSAAWLASAFSYASTCFAKVPFSA